MPIQIRTCYKCPDRKLGCHSICDKYIKEDEANKALSEKRAAEKRRLDDIYNYRRRRNR